MTSEQYAGAVKVKKANPDTVLWFRVGDRFYILREDANTVHKLTGVWPTYSCTAEETKTHAAATIAAGHKVAVCEVRADSLGGR